MPQLSALGLSRRVTAVLARNGIEDLDELKSMNERELLALPGFGPKCLTELSEQGVQLAADPYARYVCARHGEPRWDTSLSSLLLCDECANLWQSEAFAGRAPEYVSPSLEGYCLNCQLLRADIRFRQWLLCDTCERVARSIGRSVVAERFVMDRWEELVLPGLPDLQLEKTDVPTLRRRARDPESIKRPEVDFVATDRSTASPVLAIELKTGKSHLAGGLGVGARMGQFQLDASDCDDITAVMERDQVPVYLVHVQVIDRAHPPTIRYVALGAWWTDVFRMEESFRGVQRRPRETRMAAYYDTSMFEEFATFGHHLRSGEYKEIAARLKRDGMPRLYR